MGKYNSSIVNMVLRLRGSETISEMELYTSKALKRNFIEFNNESNLYSFFNQYMDDFYNNHTESEISTLRSYTGRSFTDINSILRGYWNYEKSGQLTSKKEEELRKFSSDLSLIMHDLPNLPTNIKTFRGVYLDAFKDYGITSVEELLHLKGQYLYESGFTSTSLLRKSSLYGKELEPNKYCNIEIEYLIPEEVNEAVPLINEDLSYLKSESELLLDKGCLSKIVDIIINEDKTKAHIVVLLIPKKIYDREKTNKQSINK